jgi:hypothetical protein
VTGVPFAPPVRPNGPLWLTSSGPQTLIVAELVEVETGKGADALDRRP